MPATAPRFGRAPGAWPLLGHVVALQRRPLALLDSLPAQGDLVEIRLGPRPAYVVCHPDLARQVLTDLRGLDRTGLVYERVRTAMATAGPDGDGQPARAGHHRHRRHLRASPGQLGPADLGRLGGHHAGNTERQAGYWSFRAHTAIQSSSVMVRPDERMSASSVKYSSRGGPGANRISIRAGAPLSLEKA
jgi:hypothetical protein